MWQIEHHLALWKSRRLSACVNLSSPPTGLHHVRWDGAMWGDASIHQVSLPGDAADAFEFVDDAFVRESDLIVTYRESTAAAPHTHLQWRIRELADDSAVLLELTASVQTPRLDCDPRIRVSTTVPGTCWQLADADAHRDWDLATHANDDTVAVPVSSPGVVLLTSAGQPGPCVAQAILASDLVDARLERNSTTGSSTLALTYFANRLEKGVLRRVRLQAYVLSGSGDSRTLSALAQRSLQQAPPLET
jgi:hypothetical protein